MEVDFVQVSHRLRPQLLESVSESLGKILVTQRERSNLNRPVSARIASLEQSIFAECRRSKPCWMTHWGLGNSDESCPFVDGTRVKLIQFFRSALEHVASQGRLAGIIYYDWTEVPGKPDRRAIFRCGALTEAGKPALQPM
jgi:hypothetical protein